MANHTFKVLWRSDSKIFKLCLTILQHYASKGSKTEKKSLHRLVRSYGKTHNGNILGSLTRKVIIIFHFDFP